MRDETGSGCERDFSHEGGLQTNNCGWEASKESGGAHGCGVVVN